MKRFILTVAQYILLGPQFLIFYQAMLNEGEHWKISAWLKRHLDRAMFAMEDLKNEKPN